MRILVIEHHGEPSLGVVGETFRESGVEVDIRWGERGDPIPENPVGYDGIVVLGGAMDALDDERCPYFPALVSLIRDFGVADKPVLGICLGSQLIARSYDAQVHLDGSFEFGFHPVELTDDGANDPLLGHMDAERQHLFQWHTDHYDLPEGAVRLARGEAYSNQCYRVGARTYATQFHFEVDRPMIEGWLATHDNMDERVPGYTDWLPEQLDMHLAASTDFCRVLTRKWLEISV